MLQGQCIDTGAGSHRTKLGDDLVQSTSARVYSMLRKIEVR